MVTTGEGIVNEENSGGWLGWMNYEKREREKKKRKIEVEKIIREHVSGMGD